MFFPETVIVGCGNPLFADDGFGPEVIAQVEKQSLPPGVKTIDAGTGGNEFVFSLLDPFITKRLIVIDVADFGAKPGSLRQIKISDLSEDSLSDYQNGGISAPLLLIRNTIEIHLIVCQPKKISYPVMEIGLSPEVKARIPQALQMLYELTDNRGYCHLPCLRYGCVEL